MEREFKQLEHFKEENPFKVPEGYMEGLTSQIMGKLPEKTYEEPKRVTLMDRVRPWVYLAAVFAGLGLFFSLFVKNGDEGKSKDTLLVHNSAPVQTIHQEEENEDYLEYLESQYESYILAEELDNYE